MHQLPCIYLDILPAWNDPNLRSLSHQIRSGLFFAHVRASTGTATSRANCHPFSHDGWLFMHNGQVGGYDRVRRRLENLVPDDLFMHRQGTTDSELFFLLLFAHGLEQDPVAALNRVTQLMLWTAREAEVSEPFRMTAALSGNGGGMIQQQAADSLSPGGGGDHERGHARDRPRPMQHAGHVQGDQPDRLGVRKRQEDRVGAGLAQR